MGQHPYTVSFSSLLATAVSSLSVEGLFICADSRKGWRSRASSMSHVRKKAHGAAARFAGNQPEVKGDRGNSCLKRNIPEGEGAWLHYNWKVLKGWGFWEYRGGWECLDWFSRVYLHPSTSHSQFPSDLGLREHIRREIKRTRAVSLKVSGEVEHLSESLRDIMKGWWDLLPQLVSDPWVPLGALSSDGETLRQWSLGWGCVTPTVKSGLHRLQSPQEPTFSQSRAIVEGHGVVSIVGANTLWEKCLLVVYMGGCLVRPDACSFCLPSQTPFLPFSCPVPAYTLRLDRAALSWKPTPPSTTVSH